MSLSLSEFRDAIRSEMMADQNGAIWDNPLLDRYIASAHQKVQNDFNFGFPENVVGTSFFQTVAGTLEYALPSDYGQTQLVKVGGNVMARTNKVLLLTGQALNNLGNPSQYYIYGRNLGFDMVPAGVYDVQFYYKINIAPPTENAGSVLTDDANDAIIQYAKYLAWRAPSGKQVDAAASLDAYRQEKNILLMKYAFFIPTSTTFGLQRNSQPFYQGFWPGY